MRRMMFFAVMSALVVGLVAACVPASEGGSTGTGLAGRSCSPNGDGSFVVGSGSGTIQVDVQPDGTEVYSCVAGSTTTTSTTSTTTSTTTTTVPCPDTEFGTGIDSPTAPAVLSRLHEGGTSFFNGVTCSGDSDWFQITADDPGGTCLFGERISATFTLTPGGAADVDLYLWNSPTQVAAISTANGTAVEQITFSWDGTCGADDVRTFLIEVRAFTAVSASGDPYSLRVGNLTED
ncbi:MAG TPA: hypothetical protein VJM33_10900 [Microthrixaceae bacterium]|nr:hypothetical protein [Microthrixaceae bacterium]